MLLPVVANNSYNGFSFHRMNGQCGKGKSNYVHSYAKVESGEQQDNELETKLKLVYAN